MSTYFEEYRDDDVFPDRLFIYQNGLNLQAWLEKRKSFLAEYELFGHKAMDYILCMAQAQNINPKLLLVSLQREQSLISYQGVPPQEKLDRALGVGCTDGGDIKKFYGLANQVDGCFETYRKWYEREIAVQRVNFGKLSILAKNQFTFTLYQYTPHTSSAKLTYDIWRGWWPEDLKIDRVGG